MKYALKLFKEIKKTDSIIYRRGGDYDFISFAFQVLIPAYENYLVIKFKERGIDLYNDPIQPNEKIVFPKGIRSGLKYFNEFLSDLNA